jgi:GTPase
LGAAIEAANGVLNKLDRVDTAGRAALMEQHPDAILLSAHELEDVSALRDTIIAFFEAEMVEHVLVLPYAKQGLRCMKARGSCPRNMTRPAGC